MFCSVDFVHSRDYLVAFGKSSGAADQPLLGVRSAQAVKRLPGAALTKKKPFVFPDSP